jgi:hypothetical protein
MCGVTLLFVACSYSGYVSVSQHSLGDKIRISVTNWILSFVSFKYISHYSIIQPELVYGVVDLTRQHLLVSRDESDQMIDHQG